MKVKTSITLSEDLMKAVDEQAGEGRSRSDFIERALRDYISRIARARRNARDLEILNRKSDRLNDEAEDVLSYQAIP